MFIDQEGKHTLRITLITLIIVGAIIIGLSFKDYSSQDFWKNILVEAHGMLLDVILFGIIIFWLTKMNERKNEIKRYKEEIDDLRGWKSDEASYKIAGLIRRLTNLNVLNLDLRNCYLVNADLNGLDLVGADFSRSILDGADLAGTDLTNTIFVNTSIKNTKFNDALIQNARLEFGVGTYGGNPARDKDAIASEEDRIMIEKAGGDISGIGHLGKRYYVNGIWYSEETGRPL